MHAYKSHDSKVLVHESTNVEAYITLKQTEDRILMVLNFNWQWQCPCQNVLDKDKPSFAFLHISYKTYYIYACC